MTYLDDLATAIELASLIEDRDKKEQRALLRAACWVDKKRALHTVTNKTRVAPYLSEMVGP